jgi:hypothetical protein
VLAVTAALSGLLDRQDQMTAADPGPAEIRLGAFVLGGVPDTWSVARQAGTVDVAAACLGPDTEPCAVRVLAANRAGADAETGWFAALTSPCASPSSTTVTGASSEVPVGSAKKYSVVCETRGGGDYSNVAWVLTDGVAVLPSGRDDADAGLEILGAIRLEGGVASEPAARPSVAPSRADSPS